MSCEGWYESTLGTKTTWLSGATPSKENDSFWGGTIPWISANVMKSNRIFDTDLHITEAGLANKGKLAPLNSVLLLVRGSELYNRIPVCRPMRSMTFNQDVKAIVPDEDVLPDYLLYWIQANEQFILNKVESTGIGAGKLDTKLMQNLKFEYPALEEQRSIINVLSSLDDKIELNNRMNKTLEEIAQTLFKRWFVDFKFPDENGNPYKSSGGKMVESELGMIPEGWSVKTVNDLTSYINRGITPKYVDASDMQVINQKCIRDGKLSLLEARYHKSKYPVEKAVQFGDVLINSTGQGTLGRVAQFLSYDQNITADSHVTIVRPKTNVLIDYVGFLLKGLQEYFEHNARGSTGQTELSRTTVSEYMFACPTNNILSSYSKTVRVLMLQITANIRSSEILAAIRDTLLPKLMSGEIRVPGN